MAYFALLWKARIIEKYRLKYEKEKHNSIRLMNAQNSQKKTKTLYQRWCNYNFNTKKRISKTFLKRYPEGSKVYNFLLYLKTDQTFPNFVMKSVIGFVTGIVLTYLCFMFFVFQLSISLIHATIMSSIIGVLLTLGLAFSYRIRCLVFLLIPQFFSRIGRYTLTCYALVLILTGPATNTLKNSEVLSESLACVEEQVKTNMHQINESVRKPYNSLKDSIELLVTGVKGLAAKIKMMTLQLNRLTLSIAYSLQSSFTWLNAVADSCNKKLGTPYNHCQGAIKQTMLECQSALGPFYSWLCDAVKLSKVACWPVMPLTAFCHVFNFSNGDILEVVKKKLNTFNERVNSMLYLEVFVHHSYSFNSNSSKSASQVAQGIVTEIRTRADMLLTWLSWSSCVTSLSLLLIIFRAKYYQHMYETRSRFDNRYVTKELIDLDLKRLRKDKETVLPLNRREKGKYIKTTSFRLVSSEKVHLSRSAVSMAITTFKLTIHMVADYSLYWVLMTIRHHGLSQTPLKPELLNVGSYVSGSALISKILMSLIGAMTLPLSTPPPSTIACLPNPHPPDFQRYFQIGILIFLIWFFALFEPYGLRLRHIIMGLYRPERAKARAVWLFNHIQRTRGSFIKFARRKLHREYKYSSEKEHTFCRWLQTHIPFIWLKTFLGICPDDNYCFLCGIIEHCDECDGSLVRCETPGCPGTYCTKCFTDIGQLCTICMSPADYGDLSDVSLERGSSVESDDDDDDDDDDDNPESPNSLPKGEFSTFQMEDENTSLLSKKHPEKKRRWFFSRKKKTEEQNENVHIKDKEGDNRSIFRKEKLIYKALTVRHMKFTDLDLQNERRKAVLSLGQDAACLKNCYMCTKSTVNNKLQQTMYYTNDKGDGPKRKMDRNATNKRDIDNDSKNSKQSSSFHVSITKFRQRFQNMRTYTIKRRFSDPIIRKRSKRILLIRLPSSLRTKQSRSRKQRTHLNILTRTRKTTNIRKTNTFPELAKLEKKKSVTKPFVSKILRFVSTVRRISSTTTQRSQKSDKDSDIYFQFKDNEIITAPKFITICGKENAIPGPSREAEIQTEKAKPQKKKSKKNKNKKQKQTKKQAVTKKEKKQGGKLNENCSSHWKNGSLFSSPTKFINFFRTDHAPALYNKTNHKRRKKLDKSETMLTSPRKSKKENEAERNYRISTFLSEQDWIPTQCKENIKSDDKVQIAKEVLKEVFETDVKPKKKIKKENKKDKGDRKNKKDQSDATRIIKKHDSPEPKKAKTRSPKAHAKILKFESETQVMNTKKENTNKVQSPKKKHANRVAKDVPEKDLQIPSKPSHTPKSGGGMTMPKSLEYFRSIGNYDFDPFVNLEEPNSFENQPPKPETKETTTRSVVVMDVLQHEPKEKETDVRVIVADAKSQTQEQPSKTLVETPAKHLIEKLSARPYMIENQTYKASVTSNLKPGRSLNKVLSCTRCTNKPNVSFDNEDTKRKKSLFTRMFGCCCAKSSKQNKQVKKTSKSKKGVQEKVDAAVLVQPRVDHCHCQYGETVPILDQTTQVFLMKEAGQSMSPDSDLIREIGVDAVAKTRNGVTQHTYNLRNAATYFSAKKRVKQNPIFKDASTIHFNALILDTGKETTTANKSLHNHGVQCSCIPKLSCQSRPRQKQIVEFEHYHNYRDAVQKSKKKGQDVSSKTDKSCPNSAEASSSSSNDTSSSLDLIQSKTSLHDLDKKGKRSHNKKEKDAKQDDLSLECESSSVPDSEDTKTDTTVYRLTSVEYRDMPKKPGRARVKVVTKSNMATVTDPAKLCDVATATSDWWSPILERKNKSISLSKKEPVKVYVKRHSTKDQAVATEGRVVTFSSNAAEVIPSLHNHLDIMSPSRYLLESQRYYNELFYNKYMFPNLSSNTTTTTEPHSIESIYTSTRRYFLKKRKDHHKSRKYEDSAQNRKFTPFKEQIWVAESKHMRSPTTIRRKSRTSDMKYNKMSPQTKSIQTKGVKKIKNPHRLCLKKPMLKTKKGEVNLLYRQCLSNDHLSLDCQPVSVTETSSL